MYPGADKWNNTNQILAIKLQHMVLGNCFHLCTVHLMPQGVNKMLIKM